MARPVDNAAPTSEAIAIDRKADVPVGVQLDWALSAQIRDRRLLPGQQLPTLRELAEATGLNVNTVRAAYRRLEQRGLIESHHGSGTFVAAAPQRGAALSSIAANAAHEARETGLDPRDVAAALYVTRDDAPDEPSEAARRRALREQIATLERTVAELEAEHPGVAPAPRRARRGVGPALLGAAELTHVRTNLIRRLTLVQAAIDGHIDDQRRARTTRERSERESAAGQRAAHARKRASVEPAASAAGSGSGKPKRKPRAQPTTRPAPAG